MIAIRSKAKTATTKTRGTTDDASNFTALNGFQMFVNERSRSNK